MIDKPVDLLVSNTPGRSFQHALQSLDLRAIRSIGKSDLHNHCLMGSRSGQLEKLTGQKIQRFKGGKKGIPGINEWIDKEFRPLLQRPGIFEKAVEAAFLQAKSDGITMLEMSMDVFFGKLFNISAEKVIKTLAYYHKTVSPGIDYRPELGFPRSLSVRTILSCLEPYLESGFFRSIDMYDDEFSQPVRNFKEIYRFARNLGFKCKAHAGEFGNAHSVKEAVEVLELDAVQHGISAADSPEVMKWLAHHKIQLNICPASNIALKRTRSYSTHPIRVLFDHGVKVTVNTDDVLLFDKGNSEQFLGLYRCGLFSAAELDQIRLNGLH